MSKLSKIDKKSKKPRAPKHSVTALYIGPREIRVVSTKAEASIPTPEGALLDGVILEPRKVAGAIRTLFRAKGITHKNVVTAVSGRGVLLRLIELPSMGEEAMRDAIKEEASKYMVFAGSAVVADFYSLGEAGEARTGKTKILSVVAKKEIIDSYIETIKLGELNLQAVDVGCLSLARAVFSGEPLTQGIVLLQAVEYDTATIFIFKDGKLHYLHHVDSPEELDSSVESTVSYCKREFGEDAEIKKITSVDLKDASIAKGLLLREAKEVKFPIRINLLPPEEVKRKEFNCQLLQFAKVLGVVVVTLLAYFSFLRFETYTAFRDVETIQGALNKPNPMLDELLDIARIDKMYSLEMKDQDAIVLKARTEPWTEVLGELKRIVPKKVYLSNMESDKKGRVVFEGEAVDQDAVFDFVRSLKASAFFGDVKLEGSKAMENQSEVRTSFMINCQLNEHKK